MTDRMSRQELDKWVRKEVQIGACWMVALVGLGFVVFVQWRRDTSFDDPLTWVVAGVFVVALVAGFVDDYFRGKRNKPIRAAHQDMLRPKRRG
jgi:UDP-N-acetylmuramyl pentapeptide phosphotransferase/UDP-N-acetylglucosamine-1-phosphate transferase